MNVDEILRTWPGFEKANAETIFASPAWRINLTYCERDAVLARGEPIADTLDVALSLDGEDHILSLADSSAYPDLHVLWAQREKLPPELLLALVEKECGGVLQTLENAVRREVRVKGLAPAPAAAATAFALKAGAQTLAFALDLSSELILEFGRLANIDVGHPAVRARTRPAHLEYATFDLLDDERSCLVAGGALLLPEKLASAWRVTAATDDLLHVYADAPGEISFAQMADDVWPETPDPLEGSAVRIECRGAVVARAVVGHLGSARALKIL